MKYCKQVVSGFLAFALMLSVAVPAVSNDVKADDSSVVVTGYTGDAWDSTTVTNADGTQQDVISDETYGANTIYALSVVSSNKINGRDNDNHIIKPSDKVFTLENHGSTNYEGVYAEMKTEQGKKDISLSLSSSNMKASEKLTLSINFARTDIEPCMITDDILVKDQSGTVIQTIKLRYDTPGYIQLEAADPTSYQSYWSGSHISLEGISTKMVGSFDLGKTRPGITFTYTTKTISSPGTNVGVKKFTLPSNGDYYFYRTYNKSTKKYKYYYTLNAKNTKNGQKNSITMHLKKTPRDTVNKWLKKYKFISGYDLCSGLTIEYTDGSIQGGGAAPLYLAVKYTRAPVGRVTTKVKYKKKKSVKISWSKFTSASGYRIYRSTKKNSGFKKIATVSSKKRSYVNTKLKRKKTYYYKVRAYRTINGKKYYSSSSYVVKAKTK